MIENDEESGLPEFPRPKDNWLHLFTFLIMLSYPSADGEIAGVGEDDCLLAWIKVG